MTIFERKLISPAVREARKLFRDAHPAKAVTEHERAQTAFQKRTGERLKVFRLARETLDAKAK